MRHRPRLPAPPRRAVVVLAAAALLSGCAEIHHGAEAVGRVGSSPAPVAADDALPVRTDVRTVRPRGAAPAEAVAEPAEPPPVRLAAVPSPRQIFDFHPAGSRPDAWRQPFVIDASDGPLAADVRRSAAELRAFMAGKDRSAPVAAPAKPCSETDVATARPGCTASAGR